MADLKPLWQDPPLSDVGLSGDLPTARGGDPNVDASGSSGLKTYYDNPVTSLDSASETPNSISGLPTTPSRFAPSDTPPAPPDLTDRSPGTIDEQ